MPKAMRTQMMPLQVSDARHGPTAFGVCSPGFASCLGPVFP